jgi:Rieske Fe-S protein
MSQEPQTTRREILARGAALGAGLVVLGPVLTGCQTQKDKPAPVTTGTVNIGPASDFPAGTVSMKFLPTYGIVLANESGPVLAIHPKCTHKGCIAQWDEEHVQFACPCHGSRFNILGQVTHGPARQPLPAVQATRNPDATLNVDLDLLYRRVAELTPPKSA